MVRNSGLFWKITPPYAKWKLKGYLTTLIHDVTLSVIWVRYQICHHSIDDLSWLIRSMTHRDHPYDLRTTENNNKSCGVARPYMYQSLKRYANLWVWADVSFITNTNHCETTSAMRNHTHRFAQNAVKIKKQLKIRRLEITWLGSLHQSSRYVYCVEFGGGSRYFL